MAKQHIKLTPRDLYGYVLGMGHAVAGNCKITFGNKSVSIIWDDDDVSWREDENTPELGRFKPVIRNTYSGGRANPGARTKKKAVDAPQARCGLARELGN